MEHYFEYTNTQSQDLTFIKKPFNRCSQLNPDLMEDLDEAEVYKEVIDELTHDGLKTNYSIIHEMQHVGKNLNEEFERTNVLCLFESNEDFEILSKEISREKIRTRRETLVGKFNEIFEYDIALNKLWFNRNIKIENIDDVSLFNLGLFEAKVFLLKLKYDHLLVKLDHTIYQFYDNGWITMI